MGKSPVPPEAILDRADALSDNGAAELFSADDMRELSLQPSIEHALTEIVRRPDQPLGRQLAAVEALAQGPWMSWSSAWIDSRAAAQVLSRALNAAQNHNRWGLPGAYVGRTGSILCGLPTGVVESLRPLLDDRRLLTIHGSEAATLQSLAQYRICDLASYLIACHLRREWIDDLDPAVRDVQVKRYRTEVGP
jgi:hypothetical protein